MVGGFETAQEEVAFAIWSLVLSNLTNAVRGIVGDKDFSHLIFFVYYLPTDRLSLL